MPQSSYAKPNFTFASSRRIKAVHTLLPPLMEKDTDRGSRVRELREAKLDDEGDPLTQPLAAEAVKVSLRAYQAWEAGGGIQSKNLRALAEFFGTTPHYIEYGTAAVDEEETPQLLDALSEPPWVKRIERKLDALLAAQGISFETIEADLETRAREAIRDVGRIADSDSDAGASQQ